MRAPTTAIHSRAYGAPACVTTLPGRSPGTTRIREAARTPRASPAAVAAASSSRPLPDAAPPLKKNGTMTAAAMNGRSTRRGVTYRWPRSDISTAPRMTRLGIRTLGFTGTPTGGAVAVAYATLGSGPRPARRPVARYRVHDGWRPGGDHRIHPASTRPPARTAALPDTLETCSAPSPRAGRHR